MNRGLAGILQESLKIRLDRLKVCALRGLKLLVQRTNGRRETLKPLEDTREARTILGAELLVRSLLPVRGGDHLIA